MNEARVYADGFERSFAEVKDLLEFLAERGRNAKWIRKPTNTLRLAPLEKEAQNLDAADGRNFGGYREEYAACTENERRILSGT
jgi:hypothetical protein